MNRRGFLAGILGLAVAPAVVKATSLMKISDPRLREMRRLSDLYGLPLTGDFTIDALIRPVDGEWHNYAVVRSGHVYNYYVDMKVVTFEEVSPLFRPEVWQYMNEHRVSSIARHPNTLLSLSNDR